ncbi:MAG: anti-sigma factor family protein [Planctomycetota bacterium]
MKQQTLEILIGKYLDSEITPAEQRLLETELRNNPQAKELLEQFQDLHERTREVLAAQCLEQGKTPDEIFERAWRRRTKTPLRRIVEARGLLRFAAGLAAGFVLGLALHFALIAGSSPRPPAVAPVPTALGSDDFANGYRRTVPLILRDDPRNVIRNVDYYGFTDKNGVRWLIEGYRENRVRPAVYDEGL